MAASTGPFPDLDVIAVEVTQGIQNLANSMPLVADRRTFARVHIDVIGALELAYTHGILEARRDGDLIGSIWPENGPITARANGGERAALDDSLYFRLPASWLHDDIQLRAFVYSHDPAFVWSKEPVWENNFEAVDVTFHEAQPVELHLATLHLHRSFHPTDVVRETCRSRMAGSVRDRRARSGPARSSTGCGATTRSRRCPTTSCPSTSCRSTTAAATNGTWATATPTSSRATTS